ncbi:hypothetical protein K432DRAFT_281552, partial [Lepidopterella palustris CBS 459.81]
MFYEPGKTDHGLPYDPFKACVIPRPIGWISTISPSGIPNLAPYSQFNNLTFDPPYVMFSANRNPSATQKDTVRNVEATGVFCWNLATFELRDAVTKTSEQLDYGVDEFVYAGLEIEGSKLVKAKVDGKKENKVVPMVAASPIKFECSYHSTLRLPGNPPIGSVDIIIAKVLGIHIADEVLTDGKVDVRKTMPIARCGYFDYTVVKEVFEMVVPGDKTLLLGLEGSARANRALEE